jgi:hypothetical protein
MKPWRAGRRLSTDMRRKIYGLQWSLNSVAVVNALRRSLSVQDRLVQRTCGAAAFNDKAVIRLNPRSRGGLGGPGGHDRGSGAHSCGLCFGNLATL